MRRHCRSFALLIVALAACSDEAEPEVDASPEADAQANQILYDCLIDQGFAVTRGADGSVNYVDPEDARTDEYAQALAGCKRILVERGLVIEVTEEQIRDEYGYAAALHRCLIENGFPLAPLPSEDVFVDNYSSYNLLAGDVVVDLDEVRSACTSELGAWEERVSSYG